VKCVEKWSVFSIIKLMYCQFKAESFCCVIIVWLLHSHMHVCTGFIFKEHKTISRSLDRYLFVVK